jgi:hypothetical protein
MLICTEISKAKKTAGLGVTYRAAARSMWATCPDSCALKPEQTGTALIDRPYEAAVRAAVPKAGVSFCFTHFRPDLWAVPNGPGRTVFNFSAGSLGEALEYQARGVAAVAVVPFTFWEGSSSNKLVREGSRRGVRCLDELTGCGCLGCGGGRPLCARPERDYAIMFTAHGVRKALASDATRAGGCYGELGRTGIQQRRLSRRVGDVEPDNERIVRFAKCLRPRSILRHHIVGDFGLDPR